MHFHPKNVQKFAVFYFPGDCGHFFCSTREKNIAVQGKKYSRAGKKIFHGVEYFSPGKGAKSTSSERKDKPS